MSEKPAKAPWTEDELRAIARNCCWASMCYDCQIPRTSWMVDRAVEGCIDTLRELLAWDRPLTVLEQKKNVDALAVGKVGK